jgi:hypothetical protein
MERGTRYTKLDVVFEFKLRCFVHVILYNRTEGDIGCSSKLHLSRMIRSVTAIPPYLRPSGRFYSAV